MSKKITITQTSSSGLIDKRKADIIKQEQKIKKRKKILMQAELVSITPSNMLFNALSIASTELARLNRLAQTDGLNPKDFKNYGILINSLTKLSEENRLNQQKNHLEGLTEEEKIIKVKEAINLLEDTNNE